MNSLGINQFGKLELETTPEFISLWGPIEEAGKESAIFDWNTNPADDGIFRVRVDESTHVFDSNSELVVGDIPSCIGRMVTCIIDVQKTYNFKKMSGLSCRVHQMKIHAPEYLFN